MFDSILRKVFDVEGGYSNDPVDIGGETICGIARNYWPNWKGWKLVDKMKADGMVPRPTEAIVDMATAFYRRQFWDPIRGDDLEDYDVAHEVFEIGVNLGTSKATTMLQEALNLLNRNGDSWDELIEDGRIGPRTLATLRTCLAQRNGSAHLVKVLNTLQGMHYVQLARVKPSQERFLRGWLSRT